MPKWKLISYAENTQMGKYPENTQMENTQMAT